jgi:AcrR family transcriptional regulator
MPPARPTRAERSAQTRSQLLAAAERRFHRDGYHGTTLEAIADEAGYTKGAVYSAFESKADLFLALVDEMIDRRVEDVAELFHTYPLGQSRLTALAEQPVDEHGQQWVLLVIEFWVHAAREPQLRERFARRYRRLRARLAELALESTPLGREGWAVVTIALANGLTLERLIDPDGVPGDLMATAQRLLYPPRST